MSLAFKPKIAYGFRGEVEPEPVKVVVRGPSRHWSTKELNKLVELRALGVSYINAAKLMNRGQSTLISAVVYNDLYGIIETKRSAHIAKVLYDV